MKTHRLAALLAYLVCATTALILASPAQAQAAPAAPAAPAATAGVKATYAGAVDESAARADGLVHLDTPTTISRLQALHVNTYVYLVWNRSTQWPDLVNEFMPAAQAAGIRVWVYLTPPSEGAPVPYGSDYVTWSKQIASLRASYPNLTGLAIDDFDGNVSTFTPAYLDSMRAAATAISPGLEFYATVYKSQMTASFASTYNPHLDGYIFPFRDEPTQNTIWTATVATQVDSYVATAGTKKVFLMPYASALYAANWYPPDVNYVAAITSVGIQKMNAGKIAGVVEYGLNLKPGGSNGAANWAHTGTGSVQLYVPPNKATSTGAWASANTVVTLNPGSTTCTVVAWYRKSRPAGSPAGYHQLRINVNGAGVWSRDISLDGTSWYTTGPQNLAPHLTNGSGTVSFLLYEAGGVSNYEVRAAFDDLQFSGCSVANPTIESTDGWYFTRSTNAQWVFAAVTRYSADYSSEVHQAVAALFQ